MAGDSANSDSELTDIEDEEDMPLSQRGKAKTGDSSDAGYMIKGALKVPRATTYTCHALYEQIYNGDVDLQPEYQRGKPSPSSERNPCLSGLIDSIFRNFFVPPVIFVVHTSDDGAESRVCVDGKQRLTSIFRFIAGDVSVPMADTRAYLFTGEKFVYQDNGIAKGRLLPKKYQKLFMNKQIVCMEYQDISPDNEREIFQRVQLGMALTPAERLQAISTPFTRFIRKLLDEYVVDNLAVNIEWDTSRANDFRGLAAAVYCMSKWPTLTTMPSNTTIEKWLHSSGDLDEDVQEDICNTYELFCQLAADKKLKECFWLPNIKKVAPVEVLSISLLIHAFKRTMTLAQLSESITLLRRTIRDVEKDVRQNSRTMKQALAFLKNLDPSQLQAESGSPALSKSKAGKRKRTTSDSSEDDQPPAKAVSKPRPKPSKDTSSRPPTSKPSPPPSMPPPKISTSSTTHSPAPSPAIPAPPALNLPSGSQLLSRAPTVSATPRAPPTAPASLRHAMAPPSTPLPVPPREPASLPLRPLPGLPARQNSIGEKLMARMAAPASAAASTPKNGSFHSPPMPYHPGPNGQSQVNRAYDATQDLRNATPPSGRWK
ncbi:hypothetical protein BC628DRAFT_1459616 [Trametes gibbosa]|nr:hypothetical protein BC628DRAFT_1459616 [Trametes gibbosa]